MKFRGKSNRVSIKPQSKPEISNRLFLGKSFKIESSLGKANLISLLN